MKTRIDSLNPACVCLFVCFSNPGTITFPEGGRVEGQWKGGKLLSGKLFFSDNLLYKNKEWQYCTDADRRFWTEVQTGIQIQVGMPPQMTDETVKQIPEGTYDTGVGYYNSVDQCHYDYNGNFTHVRYVCQLHVLLLVIWIIVR